MSDASIISVWNSLVLGAEWHLCGCFVLSVCTMMVGSNCVCDASDGMTRREDERR